MPKRSFGSRIIYYLPIVLAAILLLATINVVRISTDRAASQVADALQTGER